LYEYKDNTPQGCAVTDNYPGASLGGYDRGKRDTKDEHDHTADDHVKIFPGTVKNEDKVKRDVRSVKKFIEVALVLDKAMFDKRPHSSRKDVIHDAIQVANIADLVSKVYMHIWEKSS
jgi:hypothetical protein